MVGGGEREEEEEEGEEEEEEEGEEEEEREKEAEGETRAAELCITHLRTELYRGETDAPSLCESEEGEGRTETLSERPVSSCLRRRNFASSN